MGANGERSTNDNIEIEGPEVQEKIVDGRESSEVECAAAERVGGMSIGPLGYSGLRYDVVHCCCGFEQPNWLNTAGKVQRFAS
jgi:hypothetical protein